MNLFAVMVVIVIKVNQYKTDGLMLNDNLLHNVIV